MKVLFILQSIIFGGSMTSLINLVNLIKDNGNFELDMMFMLPDGALYDRACAAGNVIKTPVVLQAVTESRKHMKGKKYFKLMPIRLFCTVMGKLSHISSAEYAYKLLAEKYSNYDVVVAYQEGPATNFVRHISNVKKIAWIHNDYDNVLKIYGDNLETIYSCFDKIVCVSEAGKNNFLKCSDISEKKDKLCRIYNCFDINSIKEKAKENCNSFISDGVFTMVTVGRIARQKRFDRLIDAAEKLKDDGFKFRWYAIGGGDELGYFREQIKRKNIEDFVLFVGAQANPYSYISRSDLMVITSEFEAHPMVANEALILGVPVISTGYESAREVVTHGVTGLICENSVQGVYDSVKQVLQDEELYKSIKAHAVDFEYTNDEIKQQVIDLIRGLSE